MCKRIYFNLEIKLETHTSRTKKLKTKTLNKMSIYGSIFRVTSFGESHGKSVGCVIDGLPAGIHINENYIQYQLNRRRPCQSILTTQRDEKDLVEIISGVENNVTLGTPLAMIVKNHDKRNYEYANTSTIPRPGHADYTYKMKYGIKASSGGGRASARETVARVAAGCVAEKWLHEAYGVKISAWVSAVGDVDIPLSVAEQLEQNPLSRDEIDKYGCLDVLENGCFVDMNNLVYCGRSGLLLKNEKITSTSTMKIITRCPHPETAAKVAAKIQQLCKEEDSTGGIVTCVISGVPVGLGEPTFDKIEAELAKSMLSIPSVKGFEIGSGFRGARMKGSEHNDCFIVNEKKKTARLSQSRTISEKEHISVESEEYYERALNTSTSETCSQIKSEAYHCMSSESLGENAVTLLRCKTNNAGGALGGITTGENIVFRLAFKPVSSIGKPQETADFYGNTEVLVIKGRHDPCVLPRSPPIVESMAAIVITDMILRQRARVGANSLLTLD